MPQSSSDKVIIGSLTNPTVSQGLPGCMKTPPSPSPRCSYCSTELCTKIMPGQVAAGAEFPPGVPPRGFKPMVPDTMLKNK